MCNTVFYIPEIDENIEVKGSGQEAATSILKGYKNMKIVFKGFIDQSRKFIPVKFK